MLHRRRRRVRAKGGLIRSRCQSQFEEERERERNVGRGREGEKMIRGRGAAKKGGMLRTLHRAAGTKDKPVPH